MVNDTENLILILIRIDLMHELLQYSEPGVYLEIVQGGRVYIQIYNMSW